MSFHPNDVARRARAATLGLAATFVFLGSAFFRTQVRDYEKYALQSETNRLREVPLPAPRGIIYDRKGQVIAENLPGYTVSLLAPSADSLRAALARLGEIIQLTPDQIEVAVRRHRRDPTRPTVVLADAPFDVVSVLEEHRVDFPSLIIQTAPKRFYPAKEAVGAFAGYTGEINEAELAAKEYRDYKLGQEIGKDGLEKQYESALRGREGMRFVEVDARGRVVARDSAARPDLEPRPGPPLHTTIDMDLQRFVVGLFGDSLQGGAIVLDPNTGDVLAMHSAPSFDPNRFVGGVSAAYYDSLRNDPRKPLYNKVIKARYPPASTFKLATSAIALSEGLVTINERMPQPCTGGFQFGNRYWRCWDHSGHGDINLQQAIEKSCDVYFYQLGLKVGIARLVAGGVSLQFRERSGIDLPSESRPEFPYGIDYYNKKFGSRGWSRAEALNLAIGQGNNAQTVATMARFYTALATDGYAARPHIAQGKPVREKMLNLTPEQLDQLRAALAGVLERGTATASQIQGLMLAGKTGTAQNAQDPTRDHAWFVGFAPADKPKVLVAVLIEFGGHGTRSAAIASKIMGYYLKAAPIQLMQTEG